MSTALQTQSCTATHTYNCTQQDLVTAASSCWDSVLRPSQDNSRLLLRTYTLAAVPLLSSSRVASHICCYPVRSQNNDRHLPAAAAAAGSKSIKARQNSALAAADDAASYSLRCIERGRLDLAAASRQSAVPQEKSALPVDWGFLK
jgi:hypothetical protein